MAGKLSSSERVELVDVVEVLFDTLGKTTPEGVLIERIRGGLADGVRYVDPNNPSEPIREMSTTAYTAEFYKVCGGDLNTDDFDYMIRRCAYVGNLLSSPMLGILDIDDLKVLAGSDEPTPAFDDGACR
jgi:hypothetical protein